MSISSDASLKEVLQYKIDHPEERFNIIDVSGDYVRNHIFVNGEPIQHNRCVRAVVDIQAGEWPKVELAYEDKNLLTAIDMREQTEQL